MLGLYGRPFLPLDDVLRDFGVDVCALADVHDEICLALSQLPLEYTGGSHRSMGIMPKSREHEAVVDYGEVVRALDDDGWRVFVSLADDATAYDNVARDDVGEERTAPLSRRQMLWLQARHGVYFPWKAYLELIPNHRWQDKANTRQARTFLPQTCALAERLPFVAVGRCNIMGLMPHDHGTVHRDGEPDEQEAPDEFITIAPGGAGKELFVWDERAREEHVVSGAVAYWFNDFDYHGVRSAPVMRYSLRVDGVFTDAFRDALASRFG